MTPLKIAGLRKSYGSAQVLNGLDLEVEAHGIHGLVGLNGSGKTTTMECVLGMQRYDSGTVEVLGLAPSRLYRAGGDVVAIFDTPGLHPALTVRQSLEHARLLCKQPQRSCAEVERLLGISSYRDYRIRHLSLGNKRRASIAHALLGDPRLIILDEPFNGLDAEGVNDVLELISRLNRERGTAFLLSSHQLPYLEQVCSHMAILHAGRIAVSDRIGRLFSRDHARILVTCDQPEAATRLIGESGLGRVESRDHNQLLCELLQGDAAAINTLLVSAGLAVSELQEQRDSLMSLFYRITADQTASAGAA
ncbi:MAG: ABC transporter ATP-binding protein [Pseudomonadales bacterium]|nr:ABC transporter ATP-binding protein [Pseudomonadales bacterium]